MNEAEQAEQAIAAAAAAEARRQEETARRNREAYVRSLRNAPRFAAKPGELWRTFNLSYVNWFKVHYIEHITTLDEQKRALLSCLDGDARRALELHGEGSVAWTSTNTELAYREKIKNVFSPQSETEMARIEFTNRKQYAGEPPAIYYSEKLALYGASEPDGTRRYFPYFRQALIAGLTSSYLRDRLIESTAEDDRQLLVDLIRIAAQGQEKYRQNCPSVVSLEGLGTITQFRHQSHDLDERMDIDAMGDQEHRRCFKCKVKGHLQKDCKKGKQGQGQTTERKDYSGYKCNYCQRMGHIAAECRKKKNDK